MDNLDHARVVADSVDMVSRLEATFVCLVPMVEGYAVGDDSPVRPS